jgi:DNA-directed RNA polymerase I, II, and III subunit RPABC2
MAQVIEDFNDILKTYDPSKNKTNNILSKYEKVKIIGIRAEQVQRGAPPYIDIDLNKPFDARDLAKKELAARKIPFMISRKLPDGKTEYWRLDDLMIL